MGEVIARVERHVGAPAAWVAERWDTALVDVSVRVRGHAADCCNVLVVAGEPSDDQPRCFRAARTAFEAAARTEEVVLVTDEGPQLLASFRRGVDG